MKCEYFDDGELCQVESADFSMKTIGANFTFSGTQDEKQTTTEIWFYQIGRVAHLPRNLFKEFPKLKELQIYGSDIPILRSNFFKPGFNKLQELRLNRDKIKIIEENAIARLKNLETIELFLNEIRSLPGKLFRKNRKLKSIYLANNKIKIIHPGTFKNLNQLTCLWLGGNECVNQSFGCLSGDKLELDLLQRCYENYAKSLNLLNEGEK